MNRSILEFWKSKGHIQNFIAPTTNNSNDMPEGFDIIQKISDIIGDRFLVEIGCGYGRLCTSVNDDKYYGYDINNTSINNAKSKYPNYKFELLSEDTIIVKSDIVMAYTVGLHIHDDDILAFIKKYTANTKAFIMAEIMDIKWPKNPNGTPPTFHRSPEEYEELFNSIGMTLKAKEDIPYTYYDNTNITIMEFTK